MDSLLFKPTWGRNWRSSTWFIITAMSAAFFTDTFLASFIVPILPYMLEGRVGLNPALTQSMTSWLLAGNAAVSVLIRMPLAHFADKTTSRRSWFMVGLGLAFLSTFATAFGSSLILLFLSRGLLAVASSVMWVVGFTTVANTVSIHNTGKSYAAISVASSLGASGGPMVSGILFQLMGYWAAWGSAFALLAVDMIFRLLMVEKGHPTEKSGGSSTNETHGDSIAKGDAASERSPLLSPPGHNVQTRNSVEPELEIPDNRPNFYRCIFSKPNFTGGIYCSFISGLLTAIFNATIPLHTRDAFNWGGVESGLIFAALQAPRLVMSPLVGWLKDRVGTRMPTVCGFVIMAPFIWLLGIPGSEQFPSASVGDWGPRLYIAAMVCIGFQLTFLNGAGTIEATVAVNTLQKEYPGHFGPNGGKSRAIAIAGIAYTLGLCVGPLVGGMLNDKFGYFIMSCVVAGVCISTGVVAYLCLPSRVMNKTRT